MLSAIANLGRDARAYFASGSILYWMTEFCSTLIPDAPYFPFLPPPQSYSYAIPNPNRPRLRLTERRNLINETQDLSDEEEEVEDEVQASSSYALSQGLLSILH